MYVLEIQEIVCIQVQQTNDGHQIYKRFSCYRLYLPNVIIYFEFYYRILKAY